MTVQVISYLLKPGCTSWNESLNHVIHWFVDKQRYLGAVSYEGAVGRGVCQWNDPLYHIQKEFYCFGLWISDVHIKWIESALKHRQYITEWSHSYLRYAAKHHKKYKQYSKGSDYVGNGKGLKN